jgi:small GTP-binding protein
VWDTAGQEQYRSLVPMYARSASAALVVVDTNAPTGADSAAQWVVFLRENCPSQCLGFFVANKIDLPRRINWEEFSALAKENDIPIIQTTATQYFSVASMFQFVAEEIAGKAMAFQQMDLVPVQLPEAEKGECC